MSDEEANSKTIHDLPDEVLLLIFSKLPVFIIKSKAALVCKRWNCLAQNNAALRCLDVRPPFKKSKVVQFLSEVPCLRKLQMISRNDVNEILEESLDYLRKLQVFKVNSSRESRYSTVRTELALRVLEQCPEITSFTMKRVNLSDAEAFFESFGRSGRALRKVNLNHSTQLGDSAVGKLSEACAGLEDVRLYGLAFNRVGSVAPYGPEAVQSLCAKMRPTLAVLKLNMLGVPDSAMEAITLCAGLQRLFLFRCVRLHDEGVRLLRRLRLQELVVTVPRAVSSQCWVELFSHGNLRGLARLTLANSCSVDDSVLASVSANLGGLRALSLPGCRQFTAQGAAWVVTRLPHLSHLNLFSTRPSVAQAFFLIPDYLPNLRTLIFRANGTRPSIHESVLKYMPHLDVREFYRYT